MPLGKILALVRPEGGCVFDSRVILEYLDVFAGGGRIIPAEPGPRLEALVLQALADGIADAAILQVYEGRFRTEAQRSESWVER